LIEILATGDAMAGEETVDGYLSHPRLDGHLGSEVARDVRHLVEFVLSPEKGSTGCGQVGEESGLDHFGEA
jgi:hypothetical protein